MKKIFLSCALFCSIVSVSYADYDATRDYSHADIQKYSLSCEYSALSAVLTYQKGYAITEDELIKKVPQSWWGQSAVWEGGKRIWGDPEVGFVGNVRASQNNYSGYGVYEKPLADTVVGYGLSGTVINQYNHIDLALTPGKHLGLLLDAVEKGNSVILWGDICTDPKYEDGQVNMRAFTREQYRAGLNGKNNCGSWGMDRTMTWYTWRSDELVKIEGLSGDHVFVLVGYVGPKKNPTHVRVFDTYTGFHTYPVNEWMRKWGMMQYRSLIVSNPNKTISPEQKPAEEKMISPKVSVHKEKISGTGTENAVKKEDMSLLSETEDLSNLLPIRPQIQ